MNGLIRAESPDVNVRGWPGTSALGCGESARREAAPVFDLVVADASWAWTERLFAPLAGMGARVFMLKVCDWRTAINDGRPLREWFSRLRTVGAGLTQQSLVLPPGWMKSVPSLGMRPLARAVRSWRGKETSRPLVLAMSYPHYLVLADMIAPDALIYYNMDDYALYWRRRSRSIRAIEERVVERADLSVFCARVRAEALRATVPQASGRIVHLPHGAPSRSILEAPQHRPAEAPADIASLPRPLLGFVGSLEDRVDWGLVDRLARDFVRGSIVLIGRRPSVTRREGWGEEYARASARPNVHFLGWKGQWEIDRYARAFDVCLIPYRADHPFNRVACPTKIMDYMATTRPVVSTNVPECALYSNVFHVCAAPDEFVKAVGSILAAGSDDGKAADRWRLARANTWERTSGRLLRLFLDRTNDSRLAALA
jgi:glycosyltransferase involved in cell wall biosynthesis